MIVDAGADSQELVTAYSTQDVVASDASLKPLGTRDQDPVAGLVSELVVDLLEPIEIDEHHSDAVPSA